MSFNVFKGRENEFPEIISRGQKLPKLFFCFFSRHPIQHTEMVTTISRIKSYENKKLVWKDVNTMENFAEAGFFYNESTKSIICYLCGLQISNIKKVKCPFSIHTKNNPNCTHIELTNGKCTPHPVSYIEKTDEQKCVVCQTNSSRILLLPCKHFCTCKTCTANLINCPICRQTIKSFTFIFNV
jgi:hypothetical protein